MLSILYEDYHLLAVNKPAPLLTQAPPGIPSLEQQVKEYLRQKYHKPAGVYLGIPHRLDRPVTGVIVFARNSKAARRLAEQFQRHTVKKLYWALVSGIVSPAEGRWEDGLRKLADQACTKVVSPETPGAKKAVLDYRVLQVVSGSSLLELRPLTGRSHQLRVQAAVRGHPIWGDVLYGSEVEFGPKAETPRDRVIALHARQLVPIHPTSRLPLELIADLPDFWPDWTRSGNEKGG